MVRDKEYGGGMRYWMLLLPALALVACDSLETGSVVGEYVVEGILVAGEPLPPIRLSRTAGINETYDFGRLAVRGADISVDLLGGPSHPGASMPYAEPPDSVGVYLPLDSTTLAAPLGTYLLNIRLPGTDAGISGMTTVPDTFSVVGATLQRAVYQSDEQLDLTITRTSSPGRSQNFYIIVTEALEPRLGMLTPLAADILDNEVGGSDFDALVVSGSPILNEENYDVNSDGTLVMRYPWIGINFYGPNRISINALDDNAYDYFRSQAVQQGGATFAPGEIPNPLESLNGARGIFGSYARAQYDLLVLPPTGAPQRLEPVHRL